MDKPHGMPATELARRMRDKKISETARRGHVLSRANLSGPMPA